MKHRMPRSRDKRNFVKMLFVLEHWWAVKVHGPTGVWSSIDCVGWGK